MILQLFGGNKLSNIFFIYRHLQPGCVSPPPPLFFKIVVWIDFHIPTVLTEGIFSQTCSMFPYALEKSCDFLFSFHFKPLRPNPPILKPYPYAPLRPTCLAPSHHNPPSCHFLSPFNFFFIQVHAHCLNVPVKKEAAPGQRRGMRMGGMS